MSSLKYLRKNPPLIMTFFAVLFSAVFFILAAKTPPTYEAKFSFMIDHRTLQETQDYAYGGYYALRASELFADTVVSWFKTPSVLEDIRLKASQNLHDRILREPAFRVKKFSGQNVVVSVSDMKKSHVAALANAAVEIAETQTENVNRGSDGDSLFVLKPSDLVIAEKKFSPARAGFIGLALGFALGAALVFFLTPPKR